jgi:hypothetical protein
MKAHALRLVARRPDRRWWQVPLAVAAVAAVAAALLGGAPAVSAGSVPAGAICVPSTVNASAELPGTPLLVSPMPSSADATPANQLSFLGAPASEITNLTVTGSASGLHAGSLESYSQDDGASFVPQQPFISGETVSVTGDWTASTPAAAPTPFAYSFSVGTLDPITKLAEKGRTTGPPGSISHYVSAPNITPPKIRVFVHSKAADIGGDIFMSLYPGPGETGPMILSPDGQLVWFKPLPTGTFVTNVRAQRYESKPVLTWWQGVISRHGFGFGEGEIYSDTYQPIATIRAGNGIAEDLHDLQITPQGTALITAWKPLDCDLSAVGGVANDAIYDTVMQEIDIKTGLVMYEWDSVDHVPLANSYVPASIATLPWPWDWFHLNSINLDSDGSWLISSRDTWTIYNINSATGQVNWRLGGRQPSFKMGPGTKTEWQHDARQLSPDTYSVFDNGPDTKHGHSKGLIIKVNTSTDTATLVHTVKPKVPVFAETQGDLQLLANGDWWIGWGDVNAFAELSPSGRLLYLAHSPAKSGSYRTLRFNWSGQPTTPPALVLHRSPSGRLELYASWNGATALASWRVLAGSSPSELTPTTTVASHGFQTKLSVPSSAYVAVEALNASGQILSTSPTRSRPS